MAEQLPVIDDDDDDELQENGAASSQQHGNPFSPTSQGQGAQGVYVSVDDLRVMMQQMTAATKAASDAAMAAVRANSSKASLGSSEMSRILPRPDTFKPTTREEEHSQWLQWVWSLKQYVVALDTAYAEDLKKIEQFPTAEIGWISDPDALQRSQRMYALLSGFVRGRGLQVIQRVPSQNGYEALRQLMQLFQPSSRACSLGILTALTQTHPFRANEPFLAQLLDLERVMEEYERSSGKKLGEDLKTSILLKSISGGMRNHLSTVLTETSSYDEIREAALRYERMQFKWSPSNLFSTESSYAQKKSHDQEPQPMDIGQVKGGPKGYKGGKGPKGPKGSKGPKGNDSKGKYGKAGGKESKGYSQSYNNAKGERNPGKGGKGDRKGKNNAPKGGNLSSNTTCHNCGRPGHYARDCWRPRVNQVEQSRGQPGPQPSGASVSGAFI